MRQDLIYLCQSGWLGGVFVEVSYVIIIIIGHPLGFRAESKFAPSQWETMLLCYDVSHWLGANLESAQGLIQFFIHFKAYRVIADSGTQPDSEKKDGQTQRPWCCSTEPEKAKIGINRIWVLSCQRRKKIASKLLDCVRLVLTLYVLEFSEEAWTCIYNLYHSSVLTWHRLLKSFLV